MKSDTPPPSERLGVVVVTYDACDVILDCLESLLGSRGVQLGIVIVDNGSTDGTPDLIRKWAATGRDAPSEEGPVTIDPAAPLSLTETIEEMAQAPGHSVHLIETGRNTGFAGGVNVGLAALARIKGIDRFWILNPDSVVPPDTAHAFATCPAPAGGFSLMGGRVLYYDRPDMIQIDGGIINWRTGITSNKNFRKSHAATPPIDPLSIDFITGASMVASRQFYEKHGGLEEGYFLYYEEVDWALQRGSLPLSYCSKAIVYHRAGTSIGSQTHSRPPSPFSLYFKHRSRILFLKKFSPGSLPMAQLYSFAKAGHYVLQRYSSGAKGLLEGSFGRPPPSYINDRIGRIDTPRVRTR